MNGANQNTAGGLNTNEDIAKLIFVEVYTHNTDGTCVGFDTGYWDGTGMTRVLHANTEIAGRTYSTVTPHDLSGGVYIEDV